MKRNKEAYDIINCLQQDKTRHATLLTIVNMYYKSRRNIINEMRINLMLEYIETISK